MKTRDDITITVKMNVIATRSFGSFLISKQAKIYTLPRRNQLVISPMRLQSGPSLAVLPMNTFTRHGNPSGLLPQLHSQGKELVCHSSKKIYACSWQTLSYFLKYLFQLQMIRCNKKGLKVGSATNVQNPCRIMDFYYMFSSFNIR